MSPTPSLTFPLPLLQENVWNVILIFRCFQTWRWDGWNWSAFTLIHVIFPSINASVVNDVSITSSSAWIQHKEINHENVVCEVNFKKLINMIKETIWYSRVQFEGRFDLPLDCGSVYPTQANKKVAETRILSLIPSPSFNLIFILQEKKEELPPSFVFETLFSQG